MDPSGNAYSWMEFYMFGNRSIRTAEKLWNESVEETDNVQNWGNWSGVATRPATDLTVSVTFESRFDEYVFKSATVRSLSAGHLTEMGRATVRHPNGHPTAVGLGWIGAT